MDAISDVSRGSEIFSSVPVFPPLPKPLNLDDLLGFSEAARKRFSTEESEETKYFVPNRVFINEVDSFTGKHIVSVLTGKGNRVSTQRDLKDETNTDESSVNAKENDRNEENDKESIEKSIKPKKKKKGNKTMDEEKENNEKSNNKSYSIEIAEKIPISPLKATVEDLEGSFQEEKCPFDTSKLTVAEYHEMMELDTLESRNDFLNDKLGKFLVNYEEISSLKNDLESLFQYNSLTYENQECEIEIIGSLKNHHQKDINIDGVTEIIRTTYEDPEFISKLVTCGIIIYIAHENLDQTVEATWVLNYVIKFINEIKNTPDFTSVYSPVFVLVSTFMTWSLTKPLSLNDPELPFIEKDYRKRKPHPNYELLFKLEERLIKVQSEHILKSVIIVSGIPYGHEEDELRYLFDLANCYQHLPIYYPGNNFVPTIHIENLGHVIKQTLSKLEYITTPFIFAKDPAQNTIAEISRAVSTCFGTGFCKVQQKEFAFINDMISQDLYSKITTNIILESCYPLFKEEEIPWKYQTGFTDNINLIVQEFIYAEKIKPLRVILYGVSLCDQLKDVTLKIQECCHLPFINPTSIVYEYFDEALQKLTKLEELKVFSTIENILRDSESTPELILCEEEKDIEEDLEVVKNLKINTLDKSKLLPENENDSIVARKLKMRPYIHRGYLLEEYPKTVAQANVIFSLNKKEGFNDSSSKKVSILPDLVIFFNELEDVTEEDSNETTVSESQKQLIKEYDHQETTVANNVEVIDGGDQGGNVVDKESTDESSNIVYYENMWSFFSNLEDNCLVINLDFRKSDNEEQILNKTLSVIQRYCHGKDQCLLKSSSADEQFHYTQNNNEEETIMKDVIKISNSEDNIQNGNADEGLRETEEIILAVRSHPLLSYLIDLILPTLNSGILEVTAQIPQDPIDFLAEYIFKNNPEGRMMPQNELQLNELLRNQKKNFPKIDSKACLA